MSDRDTTIHDLFEIFQRFADEREWEKFHAPKDLAIGLSLEAAEVMEHFRFKDVAESEQRLREDPALRRELAHELSDVFWYVALMCVRLDIDLSTAVREKIQIAAQKYPVERVRGKNLKYDEYPQWQAEQRRSQGSRGTADGADGRG